MINKSNVKEWFNRYKYPELAAITATVISTQIHGIFDNVTTAYFITVFEYAAFYIVVFFVTFKKLAVSNTAIKTKSSFSNALLVVKNILLEFGYPSILDFFLIRPFCMYWMPIIINYYYIDIILGKISADIVFYTLAIANYELIKAKN